MSDEVRVTVIGTGFDHRPGRSARARAARADAPTAARGSTIASARRWRSPTTTSTSRRSLGTSSAGGQRLDVRDEPPVNERVHGEAERPLVEAQGQALLFAQVETQRELVLGQNEQRSARERGRERAVARDRR